MPNFQSSAKRKFHEFMSFLSKLLCFLFHVRCIYNFWSSMLCNLIHLRAQVVLNVKVLDYITHKPSWFCLHHVLCICLIIVSFYNFLCFKIYWDFVSQKVTKLRWTINCQISCSRPSWSYFFGFHACIFNVGGHRCHNWYHYFIDGRNFMASRSCIN
jgi:hypothetical protein